MWRTNFAPAGLRGRVIFGKGNDMEELIKRLERVIQTGAPDENGQHPISAEVVLEVVKGLYEHGTNLASLGTDCISREKAIDIAKDLTITVEGYEMHNQAVMNYCADIMQLPPIQPKRGKWIEDKGQQTLMQNFIERGEVWRVCSVCGAGHMIGHKYECDKAYHETFHNFCPNCGCRMDGGEP